MRSNYLPRREFLRTGVATTAAAIACVGWADGDQKAKVMTVTGVISAGQLGVTLPHEHVQGAWVSLDGIAPTSIEQHVEMVVNLKQAELLHRVLISHDAGWYSVGEPYGGTYRGYETMFTEFLPALRKAGLTDAEIKLLTVTSPAKAFSIGIRTRCWTISCQSVW